MFALRSTTVFFLCAMVLSVLAAVAVTSGQGGAGTPVSVSATGADGTNSDIDWP